MSSTQLFTSLDVGQKQKKIDVSELVKLLIELDAIEHEKTTKVTDYLFVIDKSGQVIYL